MIIKETQFKVCECCGVRQRSADPVWGCDNCEKPILLEQGLGVTVFFLDHENTDYHFCCWSCLFRKLQTIETDNFITLPYLSFDETTPGQKVSDFWEAVKAFRQ